MQEINEFNIEYILMLEIGNLDKLCMILNKQRNHFETIKDEFNLFQENYKYFQLIKKKLKYLIDSFAKQNFQARSCIQALLKCYNVVQKNYKENIISSFRQNINDLMVEIYDIHQEYRQVLKQDKQKFKINPTSDQNKIKLTQNALQFFSFVENEVFQQLQINTYQMKLKLILSKFQREVILKQFKKPKYLLQKKTNYLNDQNDDQDQSSESIQKDNIPPRRQSHAYIYQTYYDLIVHDFHYQTNYCMDKIKVVNQNVLDSFFKIIKKQNNSIQNRISQNSQKQQAQFKLTKDNDYIQLQELNNNYYKIFKAQYKTFRKISNVTPRVRINITQKSERQIMSQRQIKAYFKSDISSIDNTDNNFKSISVKIEKNMSVEPAPKTIVQPLPESKLKKEINFQSKRKNKSYMPPNLPFNCQLQQKLQSLLKQNDELDYIIQKNYKPFQKYKQSQRMIGSFNQRERFVIQSQLL